MSIYEICVYLPLMFLGIPNESVSFDDIVHMEFQDRVSFLGKLQASGNSAKYVQFRLRCGDDPKLLVEIFSFEMKSINVKNFLIEEAVLAIIDKDEKRVIELLKHKHYDLPEKQRGGLPVYELLNSINCFGNNKIQYPGIVNRYVYLAEMIINFQDKEMESLQHGFPEHTLDVYDIQSNWNYGSDDGYHVLAKLSKFYKLPEKTVNELLQNFHRAVYVHKVIEEEQDTPENIESERLSYLIETLGHIGPCAQKAVPGLVRIVQEDVWWVKEPAENALYLIQPDNPLGKKPIPITDYFDRSFEVQ